MATISSDTKHTMQGVFPLDESLYKPTEEEKAFFKLLTGIESDEDLKRHIIKVQTSAYQLFPYGTISKFWFMKSLIVTKLPGYDNLLSLAREDPNALLLDAGCGFGHDVRKVSLDGFPAENIIACDIHGKFWDFGHELFRSTPETFPANFLEGDIFDAKFLAEGKPVYTIDNGAQSLPPLSSLTSLTPLLGRVSAISAIAFFHVFGEEQQMQLAHRLGALLSPKPGSMIFGWQLGSALKKTGHIVDPRARVFSHSPESWRDLWDGQVFQKGTVRVDTTLEALPDEGTMFDMMLWCVTRL